MTGAPPANQRSGAATIVVRAPLIADAPRLAAINIASWRAAYREMVPAAYLDGLDQASYEQRWHERIERIERREQPGDGCCVVAELAGQVAAYAHGGPYRRQQDGDPAEDTTGWGELFAVYADPAMQGCGAGSAAHDALLSALAERGCTNAALWVLRDNAAAQRWYRTRGWRADGATSLWAGSGQPLTELRLVRPTNGSFAPHSSRLRR